MIWDKMEKEFPGYTKKTTAGCLRAYLNDKKTLAWAISMIRTYDVRGEELEDIFQKERKPENAERWQAAYKHCQAEGWL